MTTAFIIYATTDETFGGTSNTTIIAPAIADPTSSEVIPDAPVEPVIPVADVDPADKSRSGWYAEIPVPRIKGSPLANRIDLYMNVEQTVAQITKEYEITWHLAMDEA